jgi:hypothetical protein
VSFFEKKNQNFEKKKQKTFTNGAWHIARRGYAGGAREGQKFFGSFFQKRTPPFLKTPPAAR